MRPRLSEVAGPAAPAGAGQVDQWGGGAAEGETARPADEPVGREVVQNRPRRLGATARQVGRVSAEGRLHDRVAGVETQRAIAPRNEDALVAVPSEVEPFWSARAWVEQHIQMLPIALVQVGVELISGERRAIHQAPVDHCRVVVEGVIEPVLEADQARRHGFVGEALGPLRRADRAGVVEVELGAGPWIEQARIGEPAVGRTRADTQPAQDGVELAGGVLVLAEPHG